ncbi:MAG: hypothetical protein WC659_05915 [Patescibacteria group bacterium]
MEHKESIVLVYHNIYCVERTQKPKKKSYIAIIGSILTLILLGSALLISRIHEQDYLALPTPLSLEQPPKQGVLASELRGRRGIIIGVSVGKLTMKPTDGYAQEGELLSIFLKPLTSYVLITIPKMPNPESATVVRAPALFDDLQRGDDVFVISFSNIAASTTFSALRVEKIIMP